ncbi:hypothetical protein ACFLZ1_03665 [Patescibacteria group bacterium]
MDKLFKKFKSWEKPVVGIGVTAFTRIGPAFLLPEYKIITLLETADLEYIRELASVYSLEKDFSLDPYSLDKQNTSTIMSQPAVFAFLQSLGRGTSLMAYKSSPKIEKICVSLGINILTNKSSIRNPFENKKEFRVLGLKAGLKLIPGETLLLSRLTRERYELYVKQYGKKLVFQLPDYKVGGGIGTFFVSSMKDFEEFTGFVKRRIEAGKELEWVNVAKFIKGIDASICGCVTRHGVLCGLLQTQLVDIEEARAFKGRSGVWLGHDWGWKQFDLKLQKKAESITQTLGKYMHKKGYKGMFGIDVVIDENNEVWPVECNARYTGGFPVYSMMQDIYNEPSFDVFHLAEFLGLDYDLDLKKIQSLYRRPKKGAHLILHNQERRWVKVKGNLKAGVYKLKNGKLLWLRPGFSLSHLKESDEFCLCDRAALESRILKPGERIVRLLFKDKIATSSSTLNDWASSVCKAVYREYSLQTIPSRTKDIA